MALIEEAWPSLLPETRTWLIDNNGDVVPGNILEELARLRGPFATDEWFVEEDADGFHLSDAAVDWVEEVANNE